MKQGIKRLIEYLGLGLLSDRCRYQLHYVSKYRTNQAFIRANPSRPLPEPFMMYETFRLDYQRYWDSGKEDAIWLVDLLKSFTSFDNKHMLDWGCGPGRIIRHLTDLLPNTQLYGTDYNRSYIDWNRKNIPNIDFRTNSITPPLSYTGKSMDIVYAISIFTHLSAPMHEAWITEMARIINTGGIFLFTSHGDVTREILLDQEKKLYDNHELVIRGNVKEGNRMYTAYHPIPYIQKLIAKDFQVLLHIPGTKESWGYAQDVWIIQRK